MSNHNNSENLHENISSEILPSAQTALINGNKINNETEVIVDSKLTKGIEDTTSNIEENDELSNDCDGSAEDVADSNHTTYASKSTEVLHIDQNEEDTDDVIDMNASDPIGQEDEVSIEATDVNKDTENEENIGSEVNSIESDLRIETDENLSEINTETTKLDKGNEQDDNNQSNKDVEEENCIIPDPVENSSTISISETDDTSKNISLEDEVSIEATDINKAIENEESESEVNLIEPDLRLEADENSSQISRETTKSVTENESDENNQLNKNVEEESGIFSDPVEDSSAVSVNETDNASKNISVEDEASVEATDINKVTENEENIESEVNPIESDLRLETDESLSQVSTGMAKTATENETDENDQLNKDVEEENCIIPDPVGDSSTVSINETDSTSKNISSLSTEKQKKFDIVPVRLEKLLDPNRLVNKDDTSNDTETTTIFNSGRPQRKAAKKAETQIKEIVAQTEDDKEEKDKERIISPSMQVCFRCSRLRTCKYVPHLSAYACVETCYRIYSDKKTPVPSKLIVRSGSSMQQKSLSIPDSIHFLRKCGQCGLHNIVDEKSLSWEAMDFCNEDCLSRYQSHNGSFCAYCKIAVQHTSMGKYSVRFGLEARQFCSGTCLEDFKKGLKSCGYCQKDITKVVSTFTLPIGDKGQLKEFCSQDCGEKFNRIHTKSPLPVIQDTCTVCRQKKNIEIRVTVNGRMHLLCSDVCFGAFKFANNIADTDQCNVCKLHYEDRNTDCYFVFYENAPYNFCSKICMNVFILFKRKIVPCHWCKVKKYDFDMIKRSLAGGGCLTICSLNCLTLYQVSMSAASARKIKCDTCNFVSYAQYHLTMSDSTIRNFCSFNCVGSFQTQCSKQSYSNIEKANLPAVPIGGPKKAVYQKNVTTAAATPAVQKSTTTLTNGLISQISSNKPTTLKISNPVTVQTTASSANIISKNHTSPKIPLPSTITKYIKQLIKPPELKEIANKMTQCRPSMMTKGVSCKPNIASQETQTDEHLSYPAIIPIPCPVYVPTPMHMFTTPYPVPIPFAIPIPVPIFIPTTKNTYKGVMNHIKEIMEKTPSNPFEADLLLMAKIVASEEKTEEVGEVIKTDKTGNGDSDDDNDNTSFADANDDLSDRENNESNNFNDDVLQMALKMASEQLNDPPTVDLEAELTSNTITPHTQSEENTPVLEEPEVPAERPRTRKRRPRSSSNSMIARKRGRQQQNSSSSAVETESANSTNQTNNTQSLSSSEVTSIPPVATEEVERPDSNMSLKYIIGFRAWKQWVMAKNEQIEQAAAVAGKKAKTFNTNILKLTTDELNYLLCLFVKEVRKPNGLEYSPDTIYYLCLSIQQYLFENGRIDNIFTDSFYEPFTNALDDVVKKFTGINENTQFIVTRVEEEHLWESKQLGAHSPHVLLATLVFFNTKYFNLTTLEEHMQLSFSHIMKHWKRNPNVPLNKPGSPASSRNVVLRFYPPQSALDAPNSRKKKLYEQHENETDPLRCPVKLYEFYLSKCPESVKQRNDVFYLQPERSCVPDSPVWYSTMPLQKDILMKILHRIRIVKEVNISHIVHLCSP